MDHKVITLLERNQSRLRLKSLTLNTFYPVNAEEGLFRFMSSQTDSLETLLIWFTAEKFLGSPLGNGNLIMFPVMKKLHVLGLAVKDEQPKWAGRLGGMDAVKVSMRIQ